MVRILGIDPGSRITGYGLLEFSGNKVSYLASGFLKTGKGDLPERLRIIYEGLNGIVREHQPDEVAVEQVFMHRNAASALTLGHARGAAVLAGVMEDKPVAEYSPTQIKKAITGKGHATKEQVQHMVRVLLRLKEAPQEDEADALAVAWCHGSLRQTRQRIAAAGVVQ